MHWPTDKKLFLLPGLDGTGKLFESFLGELPNGCISEIISYPSDQLQTFEQHVRHVESKLPQNIPIILLAESFSGPVALEVLSSGKFQIDRVIFVATFAKSPRPVLLGAARCLPLALLLRLNLLNWLIRHFCLGEGATGREIESFKKVIAEVAPEILAGRLRILSKVDSRKRLKSIKVPCCYIQAENDKLVPPDVLKAFEKCIEQLNIYRVNGPHFILQTESRVCAEIVCQEVDNE